VCVCVCVCARTCVCERVHFHVSMFLCVCVCVMCVVHRLMCHLLLEVLSVYLKLMQLRISGLASVSVWRYVCVRVCACVWVRALDVVCA
jgi:hypothetical protein